MMEYQLIGTNNQYQKSGNAQVALGMDQRATSTKKNCLLRHALILRNGNGIARDVKRRLSKSFRESCVTHAAVSQYPMKVNIVKNV